MTAAVAAGLGVAAGPAAADDPHFIESHPRDQVSPPGVMWNNGAWLESSVARGTMIYAFSVKPLAGPVAQADGLPASFTNPYSKCEKVSGATSVYACSTADLEFPDLIIGQDTPDMTTVHVGYTYVPRDGDLQAGIAMAQSASTRPDSPTGGSAKVTVKALERVARNTVTFHTPNVAAGTSVRHRINVHAPDAGTRNFMFRPGPGSPTWGLSPLARLSDLRTSKGMSCTLKPVVDFFSRNVDCEYTAGEHWIEYAVTPVGNGTTPLVLESDGSIYTSAPSEADRRDLSSSFTIGSGQPRRIHELLARDKSGQLFSYYAKGGDQLAGGSNRHLVGGGWNTYDQLTKLTPVTEGLDFPAGTPTSKMAGTGELVGRDKTGVLWYYQRDFKTLDNYAGRTRVGGGWNIYNQLVGAGDIYRDGKPDLLARDNAGVLWLYKGTGNPGSPFQSRARIGGGWNTYTQLIGSADVTGDARPDLLARDSAGVLWLYRGNDSKTDPFDARTRIGGGWNAYNQLSLVGDITGDNRADLVARDTAGVLWLYKGNTNPADPFNTRTSIGRGWNIYNQIL